MRNARAAHHYFRFLRRVFRWHMGLFRLPFCSPPPFPNHGSTATLPTMPLLSREAMRRRQDAVARRSHAALASTHPQCANAPVLTCSIFLRSQSHTTAHTTHTQSGGHATPLRDARVQRWHLPHPQCAMLCKIFLRSHTLPPQPAAACGAGWLLKKKI